ncbi:MAG: hypothetical protein EOO75_08270 [Myxococcales bacterium]|nr:MAG: hypothetical protein EOO75_08270 [Myxococcales bacterium]
MAQGRLSQLSTPTPTGLETREACNGADAWSVNPDDAVEEHLDWIHLADQGCCGSHGLEGPNRRCVCGAVLGTEWSDCGIVAEVRFDAAAVAVQTDGP